MSRKRDNIKVNNMADLRRHALNTLDMLVCGDIEVEDAKAASDLYKDVLGTLKTEIDYYKAAGKSKEIKFFEGEESAQNIIQVDQVKQLQNKWKGE